MIRRPLAVLAAATCLALTGCGVLEQASPGSAAPAPTSAPSALPTSDSGLGDSVKDAGDIPDPCTLLSGKQVAGLTGREITQIDEDGQPAGTATRFCQWQQSGGQVALFLSRTTAADFRTTIADATPVDGVGEDAFQLAGHLYVLYGTVSIDVYSRGDSDEENLAEATAIAKKVIPQI
jgi:hypothetical protein